MAYYPDISHHHPVTNWGAVAVSCPILISKATQGTSYIDPTLTRFISECENRGIPYWLYSYLNRGNELAQAQYLVDVCKQRIRSGSKYFIGYILDVEAGNSAANVKTALNWLNKQGHKTMLYTMYSEYSKYKDVINSRGSNCAWWEARYGANNGKDTSGQYPCHAGVDLHQYTSRGTVPGITGSIDLNRFVGKFKSWFLTPKGKTENLGASPVGDTLDIAVKVMEGRYGSGDQRKKLLANRYDEVQSFINHIFTADTNTLAKEVIAGKYGSGEVRKTVLGDRYREVQDAVNKLM